MFHHLKRGPAFYRYLWRLSLPMILQNLITFSLGLIDTFMVSQLGNTEMAAVTTANVPVFLMLSIVFGIQSGLGILISQYWGKKDLQNISRAIGVAAAIGTGLITVLAVIFFLFPVQVMDLLSNEHELSVLGAPYLKIIGFSYVFNVLSSIYVSAQRSVENPNFGMKVFGTSTVVNTVLNYLLIYGKCGLPAMGIAGAALATLLARVVEFIICLVCALRSKTIPLHIPCLLRPGMDMLRRFVRYASPVVVNEILWGAGNSMMTVILGYTHNSVEMLAANAVTILAAGITLLAVVFGSLPLCIVGLCLTGLSYGSCPTVCSAFVAAFYGPKYFATNFSIINFNLIAASFIATASSGLIAATGGYIAPFVLLLALSVIALALNFSIRRP